MDLLDLLVKIGVKDEATSKIGSVASNAVSVMSSAADKIGSVFSGAQKVAGALVGTIGTLTVQGGISRALNIEEAQAKLEGLGHTGDDLAAIMDNAKAAVTGTSYGLGEAASAAGVLAAAGIQAGDGLQDMQGVLSTIGSVATVSGREFGDVASIFGKVAANGKLTTEVMQQLQDSGIPVLTMLSESLGKSTEETQKLVTAGKIDFATFNQVMSDNMGSAAEVAGKTFTSAMKNAKAALSKIGEAAATPVFASLRDIFLALNPVLNDVAKSLSGMGDVISSKLEGPTKTVTDALNGLHEKLSGGLSVDLANISPAAVGAAAALAAFSSGGIAGLLSSVPVLGEVLGGLGGVFRVLGGPIGIVTAALVGVLGASGRLTPMIEDLKAKFDESLRPALENLLPKLEDLGKSFEGMAPFAQGFGELVGGLVLDVLTVLANIVGNLVDDFNEYLAPALNTLMSSFSGLAESLEPLMPYLEQLGDVVGNVIIGVLTMLVYILSSIVDIVTDYVVPALVSFADTVSGIPATIDQFVADVQAAWDSFWDGTRQVFSDISAAITEAAYAANGAWEGVVSFFQSIPGTIQGFFAGAGSWLSSAGQAIMDGLLGGLKSAWGNITSFVGGIGDWIVSHKGPLDYDKVMLVPAGKAIIGGLGKGLESAWGGIKKQIAGYNASLANGFSTSLAVSTSGASAPSMGGGYVIHVHGDVNVKADDADEFMASFLGTVRDMTRLGAA